MTPLNDGWPALAHMYPVYSLVYSIYAALYYYGGVYCIMYI